MLFSSAINYTRLSEFDQVYEKCVFQVAKYFPDNRVAESLSTKNLQELAILDKQVDSWVCLPDSGKKLELNVASASVRKELDRKIREKFGG